MGDRRHHRVRRARATSTGCSPTRPARQPLDALEARLRGGAGRLARDDPRHQARGRRRDPAAPRSDRIVREVRRAGCRRGPSTRRDALRRRGRRAAGLLPGLPLLPARGPRAPRRGVRAGAASTARTWPRRSTRSCRCWPTRTPPPARRFQQTSGMVMAKGVEDCAFYRCSRLTSLNEVGGDPSVFAITPGEFHDADGRAAARLAARDDHALDPRHQARRGRPRPDHRAGRGPRRVGGGARRAARAGPAARPGLRRACCGRPSLGAWPAVDGERAARVRREGDARGRRPDHVDRARRGLRGGRARRGRRGVRRRPRSRAVLDGLLARVAGAGLEQRARREAARAHDARACPTSTRAASCGSRAWSTPTTAARRLRPARDCSARSRGRRARADRRRRRPGRRQAAGHPRGADAAPRPARALHVVRRRWPPRGAAADHVLAFDRGGAVTVVTRLPVGLAARGGWGDTDARAARRRPGATC